MSLEESLETTGIRISRKLGERSVNRPQPIGSAGASRTSEPDIVSLTPQTLSPRLPPPVPSGLAGLMHVFKAGPKGINYKDMATTLFEKKDQFGKEAAAPARR